MPREMRTVYTANGETSRLSERGKIGADPRGPPLVRQPLGKLSQVADKLGLHVDLQALDAALMAEAGVLDAAERRLG